MSASITSRCPAEGCFRPTRIDVPPWPAQLHCDGCGAERVLTPDPGASAGAGLGSCAVCGGSALFRQVDLDQRVGCAVMSGGIALALLLWWKVSVLAFVPTLLSVWLLDRLLRLRVPDVVICYACDTEYRGFPGSDEIRPWDAHIGERYSEGRFERGKR